jgi:Domain of unknown function (DUF3601)
MDNRFNLIPGQAYVVVKSFVDYDGIVHQVGEVWTYQGTNFLPYEDGLTLHVVQDNKPVVYRLQLREYAQAEIIEHFRDYIEPYS